MSGPENRRPHSRRRRRQDDHDNHEAWAIPYGDLVTLLLAFFVVMYAMSSVNEGKYRVLSDSLAEAFHGTPRSSQPLEADGSRLQPIEQLPLTQVHRMISSSLPARHIMSAPTAPAPAHPTVSPTADPPSSEAQSAPPGGDLERLAEDVSAALAPLIASGNVRVRRYDSWIAVDISTDILFVSGVARLSGPAVTALQRLADTLRSVPNAIRVEGHTDNRPINTPAFPSNWELSAARAASVVHLFMDRGIAAQRLAVVGYGEYRPAMSNATQDGRNANRRVEVLIYNRDSGPDGLR
ncbi:MAG TPA: flagellar motor protein MotD [Steroidobacteraceae bacterium]|jgi:chemotaxis protein MotB